MFVLKFDGCALFPSHYYSFQLLPHTRISHVFDPIFGHTNRKSFATQLNALVRCFEIYSVERRVKNVNLSQETNGGLLSSPPPTTTGISHRRRRPDSERKRMQ